MTILINILKNSNNPKDKIHSNRQEIPRNTKLATKTKINILKVGSSLN